MESGERKMSVKVLPENFVGFFDYIPKKLIYTLHKSVDNAFL